MLRDFIFGSVVLLAWAWVLAAAIASNFDPAPRPSPRQEHDDMTTITDSTADGRFSIRLRVLRRSDPALPGDPVSIHIEAETFLAEDTVGAIQIEYWPTSGRTVTYVTPLKPDHGLEYVLDDVTAELASSRRDLLDRKGPPPGFVRVPWRERYEGHWLLGSAKPG